MPLTEQCCAVIELLKWAELFLIVSRNGLLSKNVVLIVRQEIFY